MPKGDKPPITTEQLGLPKADAAAGQVSGRDDVAAQDAGVPHDTAATQEQPSIEKLKAELFDREVPEEYKKIIKQSGRFEVGGEISGVPTRYSEDLTKYIQNRIYDEVGMKRDGLRGWSVDPDRFPFPEHELTPFGKLLKECMGKSSFIDLGSSQGSVAQVYAHIFGAARYIGVDSNLDQEQVVRARMTELYLVQEDMLAFVSQLKNDMGATYYLSGIEVSDEHVPGSQKYRDALAREMFRTMQRGDLVILGTGTNDFPKPFEDYGFTRLSFAEFKTWDHGKPPMRTMRIYVKK